MKKLLPTLVMLLVGLPLWPQDVQTDVYTGVLSFDVDSATLTFCKGAEGFRPGPGSVTNSGSTLTCDGSTGCFAPLSITSGMATGDAVLIGSGNVLNFVTAKASDNSITLDAAPTNNVTSVGWRFIHFVCGTGADDGWLPLAKFGRQATLVLEINQQNTTTGIDARFECRSSAPQAQPIQVFPSCPANACNTFQTYTATAGIATRTAVVLSEPWKECRVGLKLTSTDDGTDTGSAAEQVNVYLMGRK